MKTLKLFFWMVIIFLSFSSNAQLYFQNNSTKPVYVAYAIRNDAASDKAWYSYGWYSVDPNEKVVLSASIGLTGYLYYYAMSHDGKSNWDGTNRDNSLSFLVHPIDQFTIKNANLKYMKENNPDYEWKSFRYVDLGGFLKTKHTITIGS